MRIKTWAGILSIAVLVLAQGAWAHPGHEETGAFMTGFMHPVLGADHLIAMLAVGLWAVRLGARAVWALPLTFMTAMGVGATLAFAGIGVPLVEPLVAASVLVLGLVLVSGREVSAAAPFCVTAAFAIFHGVAHGAEIPVDAGRLVYLSGFTIATGLIHIAGIGIALMMNRTKQGGRLQRLAAAPIALAGAWMLASAM
jgi:urease accessory protein